MGRAQQKKQQNRSQQATHKGATVRVGTVTAPKRKLQTLAGGTYVRANQPEKQTYVYSGEISTESVRLDVGKSLFVFACTMLLVVTVVMLDQQYNFISGYGSTFIELLGLK